MNTVEEYIHKLNSKSHILSKEEFEKNTALKYYCPVIDTEVARFLQIIILHIANTLSEVIGCFYSFETVGALERM